MAKINLVFLLLVISASAFSQKYVSENSTVSFFSDAAIEDISGKNSKASSIFNLATGEIVFSIPIKDFQFEKALMKEHFNEKYMETEKFSKSTFQGKIIDFQPDMVGEQKVRAQGKLTIHGETKNIDIAGTIEKQGSKLVMKSKFFVVLEDYKIMRPQLLWQNIAEQVEVTLEFTYKAM
jgi:YceI-like domain